MRHVNVTETNARACNVESSRFCVVREPGAPDGVYRMGRLDQTVPVCKNVCTEKMTGVTPNYRATFTGDLRNVPLARNAIASFARLCGFTREEIDDIRLAAGEALSNAVEHGRSLRASGFSVRCTFEDEELTIEIRDNGEGFTLADREEIPLIERTRGFGIFLMRRLMDGVRYDRNGTCVRMIRRKVS